jgi:hypothetical protein
MTAITHRTIVAYLYPENKRITLGTLKKHFSRERLLEMANEFLRSDKHFRSDISYDNLVKGLMSQFEVTLTARPDKKPLPDSVSRLIFIQRKPRKMRGSRVKLSTS